MSLAVRPSLVNPALLFRAAPQLPLQPAAGSLLLAEILPAMVTRPRRDAKGRVPDAAQRLVHTVTISKGVDLEVEIDAPASVGRPTTGTWDFWLALEDLATEGRFDTNGKLIGKPLSEYEWLKRAGRAVSGSAFRQLREEVARLLKSTVTIKSHATAAALARAQEHGVATFTGQLVLGRGEWILRYTHLAEMEAGLPPQVLHDIQINPVWLESMAAGQTYWMDSQLYRRLQLPAAKRLLQVMSIEIARQRIKATGPWIIDEETLLKHLGMAGQPLFKLRPRLKEAFGELMDAGAIVGTPDAPVVIVEPAGAGHSARPGGALLAIAPARGAVANGLLRAVTLDEMQDREWLLLFAHLRAIGVHAKQAREMLDTHARDRIRQGLQFVLWEESLGHEPTNSWGAWARYATEHPDICDKPAFREWQATMTAAAEPRLYPKRSLGLYLPAPTPSIPSTVNAPPISPSDVSLPVLSPLPPWAETIVTTANVPTIVKIWLRVASWFRDDTEIEITMELGMMSTTYRRATEAAADLPITWCPASSTGSRDAGR